MSFPIILINSLSILLLCVVIAITIRMRRDTGAPQLIVLSLFMLIWATGSFLEMTTHSLEVKILWRNFTQVGVFGAPAATLIFAITYTGILRKYVRALKSVIYGVQAAAVLFILTDHWHHLARTGISIVKGRYYETLVVGTTTLSRVIISLNFVYMAAALAIFLLSLFLTMRHMKKQISCIITGMAICVVYALLKVSFNEQFMLMLPISGVFALADLFMLFGILKYDLFTLGLIAKNTVFDIVDSGIITASAGGNIVDVNPAALKIFAGYGLSGKKPAVFGELENHISASFPDWHGAIIGSENDQVTLTMDNGSDKSFYLCDIYPVKNGKRIIGSISVFHDVTEQKMNTELFKRMAETDGLTGVNNRKTFIDKSRKLLEAGGAVCLLFIDVDFFKKVNDTYGHVFGDRVLVELCGLIQPRLRNGAFMGRMGGEEFAVFCAAADKDAALRFAEELRAAVEAHSFDFDGRSAKITISIGAAFGPFTSFDELYHIADDNLYKSKAAGRNRVSS